MSVKLTPERVAEMRERLRRASGRRARKILTCGLNCFPAYPSGDAAGDAVERELAFRDDGDG